MFMRELFELFLTFARIGGLTFGGGYAMMPILQREIIDKRGWAAEEDLTDYYAIGQCTPGVISVNTAIFIGYKRRGAVGGIAAALGVAFPSLVVITIIAAFLQNFTDHPVVQDAFAGVSVCVSVLIFIAVLRLWRSSVASRGALAIFCAVFGSSAVLTLLGGSASPVLLVVLSGAAGLVLRTWQRKLGRKGGRR